jgi:transcriptional regulator with XRE-family HTH domain
VVSTENWDAIDDPVDLFELATAAVTGHQLEVDRLADLRARAVAALVARGYSYRELANVLDLSAPRIGQIVSGNKPEHLELIRAWAAIERAVADLVISDMRRPTLDQRSLLVLLNSSRAFDEAAVRDLQRLRDMRNRVLHGALEPSPEDVQWAVDRAAELEELAQVAAGEVRASRLVSHENRIKSLRRERARIESERLSASTKASALRREAARLRASHRSRMPDSQKAQRERDAARKEQDAARWEKKADRAVTALAAKERQIAALAKDRDTAVRTLSFTQGSATLDTVASTNGPDGSAENGTERDDPSGDGQVADASGFWSYVHKDDLAERGRISQLARDVVGQYEMITGETIQLFLDRDSIEWGDEWRAVIDSSLASVAFFIPVLTPRYFQSAECRRELGLFARRAKNLGAEELVLPLKYVEAAVLDEDPPVDEAAALVRSFQWQDWTQLRFAAPESSEYRSAVAKLAARLAEANARVDKADLSSAALAYAEEIDSDGGGIIDRIAEAEHALPQWVDTLNQMAEDIQKLGELLQTAIEEFAQSDARQGGFAGRLAVIRRLVGELDPLSKKMEGQGNEYSAQLGAVDDGIRLLIDRAGNSDLEPAEHEMACDFFRSIRELVRAADEGLGNLSELIDGMLPAEKMSRDLRPPLRRLRQTLTLMMESRKIMGEWGDLVDASGIEC